MKRPLFITFEGPEGAGKTTQIRLLKEYLQKKGIIVLETREPGGTPLAEKLRDIVKYHTLEEPISDKTEVLLFTASRAQHINYFIKPAIKAGKTVLCDRFIDSTIAYQGYARGGDIDFLNILNNYAISNCEPDITFLLDISQEDGFDRIYERNDINQSKDRIEMSGNVFHKKVRLGFLELEKKYSRIKKINGEDTINNIHNQIINIYENYEK